MGRSLRAGCLQKQYKYLSNQVIRICVIFFELVIELIMAGAPALRLRQLRLDLQVHRPRSWLHALQHSPQPWGQQQFSKLLPGRLGSSSPQIPLTDRSCTCTVCMHNSGAVLHLPACPDLICQHR